MAYLAPPKGSNLYRSLNTCRFCDNWRDQEMIKYGTRHYAHFECYLDAGKPLSDLHSWQIGQFPYSLLKARGLLSEAERLVEIEKNQ